MWAINQLAKALVVQPHFWQYSTRLKFSKTALCTDYLRNLKETKTKHMKTTLAALALLGFVACNQPATEKAATTTEEEPVTLPAKIMYDGKAEIGKTANLATVMQWNNYMIAGAVDSAGTLLADTLTAMLADGTNMTLVHDSAVAMLKQWRGSMDSAKQVYGAAFPVDNTTRGDEWVVQWTTETYYLKNGKAEKHGIAESYRLKGGKIREITQYARPIK